MKVYCIGVGGIGLSALARYYKHAGHEVSGSDMSDSDLLRSLRNEGISIDIGHKEENIETDVNLVIYSIAVTESNIDFAKAKSLGIKMLSYPEALGEITKEKTTIAICGTHGKTTTTAMTYYAMKACGINPTVIVGSILSDGGSNFVAGDSEYMIVEACEYKRSFLNLHPAHIIVTNIDADHLDYYKDIDDIKNAFQTFVGSLPEDGTLTTHHDVTLSSKAKHVDADVYDTKTIKLNVLGNHNKQNASLVLGLFKALGFDEIKIREGLKNFPGTWRRLEYKGETTHRIPVYDDYGHHPREIAATLEALKEKYPADAYTIVMLFQPHLYSRTKALFNDFVEVLKDVGEVCILPIYKARLEDISGVDEDMLVEAINQRGGNAKRLLNLTDIPSYVESLEDSKTVVVNMGAGNAFEEINKIKFTQA